MEIQSFIEGAWYSGKSSGTPLIHAVTGEALGAVSSEGVDFKSMLEYARKIGGPKLRALTFHQRALMLKAIAKYLMERKDELYKVSAFTGATKGDSWIDIEGGIGTFFVFSSKARRELPNAEFLTEGQAEALSKNGTFIGRHICVPLEGVAVHINAFNFPCWGMLEKLAPTFIAGMPAIVKPASATSYLAERMVRMILESGILPEGALQIVCGSLGDTFAHLNCQDVVTFTGSAETGKKLKTHPSIVDHSIRFNLEADSLNCCILGPDATPGTEEFQLFIKEVAREITVKAGQKCTAIRRSIVPDSLAGEVIEALKARLAKVTLGDPAIEGVSMGPLASKSQQEEVRAKVAEIAKAAQRVIGDPNSFEVLGGNAEKGAFFPAMVLYCEKPLDNSQPHDIEAFGPVTTIIPYASIDEAIDLARRGRGSLVGSVVTGNAQTARRFVLGLAPYHGRVLVLNKDCAKESTGHGSPMPHLIHGGPGRAGGGEEMGGIRGVMHYLQRAAIQGDPTTLAKITNEWSKGAALVQDKVHPFQKYYEELDVGQTLITHRRTVTEADIVNFAGISGDFFYAHMDDIAAKTSIFEKRVAHGYFVLSAAAGLFVHPAPGPVLANYGLEGLRFTKPVHIGDSIYARFTCKTKYPKEGEDRGVVIWDVEVFNQADETVAVYTILTLVAMAGASKV